MREHLTCMIIKMPNLVGLVLIIGFTNDLSPYVLIDSVPEDQIGAYVPWLFPNIGLGETEGAWSIFHVIPLAPDKTMVVIRGKGMDVSDWEATKQYTKSGFQSFWTKYGNTSPKNSIIEGAFSSG